MKYQESTKQNPPLNFHKLEAYLDIKKKKTTMPMPVSSGIFVISIDSACAGFSLSSDNYSSD